MPSNSVEHRSWCPPLYGEGICGQRIAVCGHSHYSDDKDYPEFTNDIVGDVVNGAASYRFFTSISRAFEFEDVSDFWRRVLFFNFIPSIVGGNDQKFSDGAEAQIEAGRARVLRLIEEHCPHKLFVFSRKAWQDFPQTIEEQARQPFIGTDNQAGTYMTASGHRVIAIASRHPNGSSAATLRSSVEFGMNL